MNLAVARLLIGAGRQHASLTLEADGRHLMTDVWTSVGVVAGVVGVAVSGWDILDPLIALAVAANILLTGVSLVRRLDRRHDGPRAHGRRAGPACTPC